MSRVFIGIGSNDGDRLAHISNAIKALGAVDAVRVVQTANIIETEPVGGPPQDRYLNTVAELETTLAPRALLSTLKAIEQQLGRQPASERWGPRPIDLDILLYEDEVIDTPELTIPHPRMHERQFVLEPLVQIAPDVVHPRLKHTLTELCRMLDSSIAH